MLWVQTDCFASTVIARNTSITTVRPFAAFAPSINSRIRMFISASHPCTGTGGHGTGGQSTCPPCISHTSCVSDSSSIIGNQLEIKLSGQFPRLLPLSGQESCLPIPAYLLSLPGQGICLCPYLLLIAAWAAASLAIGTRNGEHETYCRPTL